MRNVRMVLLLSGRVRPVCVFWTLFDLAGVLASEKEDVGWGEGRTCASHRRHRIRRLSDTDAAAAAPQSQRQFCLRSSDSGSGVCSTQSA